MRGIATPVPMPSTGCARYRWSKAGGTVKQFHRDNTERTRERTGEYGILGEQVYRACLIARRWVRSKPEIPRLSGFATPAPIRHSW